MEDIRSYHNDMIENLSLIDFRYGIKLLERRYEDLHIVDSSVMKVEGNPYLLIAMFDYASLMKILRKREKYGDLIKDETVEHSWDHLLKEFGELLIAKAGSDNKEFIDDLLKVIEYSLEKRKLVNDGDIKEELFDLANTCRIQYIQRMKG